MYNIYKNEFGLEYFNFEGREVMIMKYSPCFCRVNDLDRIYVNQQFMEQDENTQKFVLYHEFGHIYYGHNKVDNSITNFKRKIFHRFGLVVKQEIQADFHAVRLLGKENALKAITETIKFIPSRELKTRRLLIKLFAK
jgi:Zn-dependent peptidase ImmA (M78 family)